MKRDFLRSDNIKKILYVIIIITVLHAFLLITFIAREAREKVAESNSVYEFINVIDLVSENLNIEKTKQIFAASILEQIGMDDFSVETSLTKSPLNKNLFYGKESTKKYLSSADNISFSLKLKNNYWLNLSVEPTKDFYISALFYMVVEFIIISVVLLFFWSAWRFTTPLDALKKDLKKIGKNLDIVIPNNQDAPLLIQELSEEINRMQHRIESLLASRTKLIAAISHDLRTPITRLRLILQFIPEAQTEKIMNNLTEMEKMIESVLAFTVVDNIHDKKVKVDVCALLHSLYEDFSDMGHKIYLQNCENHPVIYGKFLALKRAFTNIIDNALKYATRVNITLEELAGNKIKIVFQDNGPGIPDEKLKKVFEAYYRVNQQEKSGIKGTGLGLTITDEIISDHGGTISLKNVIPKGLKVSIILPSGINQIS